MAEPAPSPDLDGALTRARAALAAGAPVAADDVAALIAGLEAARAESAARWEAIGKLAPAAKAQRGRAQDLARTVREARAALVAGAEVAAVVARLDAGLGEPPPTR